MGLFESLFDIMYLVTVIALGVRLCTETTKGARLFGIMAIVLGLGDSFHLLPRVISHLSPGGFAAHGAALSWGQFVASITMTLFYVLFYHYYANQSGDKNPAKRLIIYVLAALRVALVLLPQNEWGAMPGNYLFGIYRNIPFAVMGALLILWTHQKSAAPGLKHMSLLVTLSFAFYIPVVLWAQAVPAIGAMMMPKTVAYLLIVVLGYRHFIRGFRATNVLAISGAALVMGLIGGVFYREFTRFYDYTAPNHLGKLHAHTLVLGFLVMLALYLVVRSYSAGELKPLLKPLKLYLAGLFTTLTCFVVFGIYDVIGEGARTISTGALAGISGLGHAMLGVGIVRMFAVLYRQETARRQESAHRQPTTKKNAA